MSRKKQTVPVIKAETSTEHYQDVPVTADGLVDDPAILREIASEAMECLSLMIAVAMGRAQMTQNDLAQMAALVKSNYPLIHKVEWVEEEMHG